MQGQDRSAGKAWQQACGPCRLRWGKRGARRHAGGQDEALSLLAERIGQEAAAEARALVRTAAEALTSSGDHHDAQPVLEAIERAAQHTGAAIGLAALAGVVDWAGARTPARDSCPDAGHQGRLVARRAKTIRTLLGSVAITRGYYYCHTCRAGFAPLDTRLGIQDTSLSPGLARACALAGAEMAYAKSYEFIGAVTGLDLASTSTLARATRTQGTRARALIEAESAAAMAAPHPVAAAAAADDGPDLCYIVIDGTGAPMLPRECAGRAGKDPTKNDGRASTREVKIGAYFTQSGRDPVTGDPVQDPGSATYISTFAPAATFATQTKATTTACSTPTSKRTATTSAPDP